MNLLVFGVGVVLILASLRSRHEALRSFALLVTGALLVIIAGLLTLSGLDLEG